MINLSSSRLRGCLYMLVAMFFFSAMNILIRFASDDLPTPQIVFLRNLFSVIIFLPWLYRSGLGVLRTRRIKGHFWRAFIGIVSMEMWFYCLAHMNLAQATALNFTSAIFVIVIAVFFLKEKTSAMQIAGVMLGFSGALIIIQPGTEGFNAMTLLVLASSAIMAVSSVLVKTLTRTEKSSVIVFYMVSFMTPLSFPLAYYHWKPLSPYLLLILFLLALSSTVAHTFITRAYARAPLVVLMPMDFIRLLFTAVMAYFLFNQSLSWATLAGATFIIAGALLGTGIKEHWVVRKVKQVEAEDVKE